MIKHKTLQIKARNKEALYWPVDKRTGYSEPWKLVFVPAPRLEDKSVPPDFIVHVVTTSV